MDRNSELENRSLAQRPKAPHISTTIRRSPNRTARVKRAVWTFRRYLGYSRFRRGLHGVMLHHRNPDKARRYLELLDVARCNGSWQEVPELVRKVGKHAQQRKCLTTTAHSEYQIATQSTNRPSTSSYTANSELSQLIPPLLTAIENEKNFPEDAFQAQVCLGWLHWVLAEPSLAISRLPANFGLAIERLSRHGTTLAGWTQVCLVKGPYIRGASQEKTGNPQEAAQTYHSIMPYVSSMSSTSTREERLWTERLLARLCLVSINQSAHSVRRGRETSPFPSRLGPFRAWATFWEGRPSHGSTALDGGNSEAAISRRRIWQAYYHTLSEVLERVSAGFHDELTTDMTYDNSMAPPPLPLAIAKLRLFQELRKVEATYEGLLLKEIKFPMANETNLEVEQWTDQVTTNWRMVCGPTWSDDEIGEGGQEAAGRNTLDILYRAATKTFHSTAILRNLFSVHTSLAEFELAGRALDSYLEIVTRNKARAEKSGASAIGLDDGDTVLVTTAAGINMLCTYGRRKEAEKARDLGVTLERWLQQHHPGTTPKHISDRERSTELSGGQSATKARVTGKCLAAAYKAVGISQAHWARLTYETSKRADLHSKAISNLRRALQPDFEDEHNVETLYTLGLVLAETRDLDGAIAAVKEALAVHSRTASTSAHATTNLGPEKNSAIGQGPLNHQGAGSLVNAWHLLALLLSARQDFATAAISCEAAFDQIEGVIAPREQSGARNRAYSMGQSTKQNIVELKMTQIALAEVFDGPEVAVNGSGDLLDLFARLFQYSERDEAESKQSHTTTAPGTSNGATRSVRGSLFHRHKEGLPNKSKSGGSIRNTASGSVRSFSNDAAVAPTISVTDNNGAVSQPPNHSSHHFTHSGSKKLHKSESRRTVGSVRRSRKGSPDRFAATDGSRMSAAPSGPPVINGGEAAVDETANHGSYSQNSYATDGEVGVAISGDIPRPVSPSAAHAEPRSAAQPLPPIARNFHHANHTVPTGHMENSPGQDVRLPSTPQHSSSNQPGPRYAQAQRQRLISTLLVKVWLLIAGLYRRASMHEDAQDALDEAFKHVKRVETAVASDHSSAQSFAEPGWGGLKSVEELWADAYSEKGNLCLAQSSPHEAMASYELAISHHPDHPGATVALSTILLDIYAQIIPAQPTTLLLDFAASITDPSTTTISPPPSLPILATIPSLPPPFPPTTLAHRSTPSLALGLPPTTTPHPTPVPTPRPTSSSHRKTPAALDRLAARDRAYGLLSSLTKRGEGWDCSEAWYALARAYEEGGQVDRAKEALWWVVELEEGRPVRGWGCLGRGYGV